ncbi:MAG: fibronectin type III domain-containing protein, partial [Schleiferiaceae bacterium]
MKKLLLVAFMGVGALIANAQVSSDTLTYNRGTLGVQSIFPVNTNSQAICADTLGISIPSGHWIASIEMSYELQTQGGGFGGVAPSDVGTYLELVSESSKEGAITYGSSNTNGDTESLTRTINDFNGAVTDTFLVFKLHPLRQGFTAVCDTNQAKLTDSTFQIIVNHYPAPTCFQPTNLTVDWKVSNQVQLSWITGGSSSWEVEYGAPGFTPGTGTRVSALSNPFVLSGLAASTPYEFIVRDSCAAGDVSLWSVG